MIGLAVLSLLADAASKRPLIVAVDDAQWLDEATANMLAFVARRVRPMPVAVVLAVREPAPRVRALDDLPGLRLSAEPPAAARPVNAPGRDCLRTPAPPGGEAETRSANALARMTRPRSPGRAARRKPGQMTRSRSPGRAVRRRPGPRDIAELCLALEAAR